MRPSKQEFFACGRARKGCNLIAQDFLAEEYSENIFEFLDLGNEGENIKYWHSQSDDFKVNKSCGEGSP